MTKKKQIAYIDFSYHTFSKNDDSLILKLIEPYSNIFEIEKTQYPAYYVDLTSTKMDSKCPFWLSKTLYENFKKNNISATVCIAPNKMLSKLLYQYHLTPGYSCISQDMIATFIKNVPLTDLPNLPLDIHDRILTIPTKKPFKTCGDLQALPLLKLKSYLNKDATLLNQYIYGEDKSRIHIEEKKKFRQMVKVHHSFPYNLQTYEECVFYLEEIHRSLLLRLKQTENELKQPITHQHIRLKFSTQKTVALEIKSRTADLTKFKTLLQTLIQENKQSVSSISLGLKLDKPTTKTEQTSFTF